MIVSPHSSTIAPETAVIIFTPEAKERLWTRWLEFGEELNKLLDAEDEQWTKDRLTSMKNAQVIR
jgi:hypothetical protein